MCPNTGMPVRPGESGEVVVTTLTNEAMPLIRYKTGNISRMLMQPCACGSNLHRMEKISGRTEDLIEINQHTLCLHKLTDFLFSHLMIRGFRAGIRENEGIHLKIDAVEKIDIDSLLRENFPGIQFFINYEKTDPFTHRGKRRWNQQ